MKHTQTASTVNHKAIKANSVISKNASKLNKKLLP